MNAARLAAVLAAILLAAPASASNVIQFKGRAIDLDAYLQGYPYTPPVVDLRSGKLFYKKRGKTDQLMMQSFDVASRAKVDLARGRVISPRDFSKRTWWGAIWSPLTRSVIIDADENSDEVFNLYSLDPEMYKKLRSLGKDATLVELVGQGHDYEGVDALARLYGAFFDFLANLP